MTTTESTWVGDSVDRPVAKLAAALAQAQSEMSGATKDAKNPHFGNKYADLASVVDACRPLSTHGIAILQPTSADGNKVTVRTLLIHTSGEWISSDLTMTAKDASPQAIGSAITYGRRYALMAMVGIAPEDDDGNAASPRAEGHQQVPPIVVDTTPAAMPPAPEGAVYLAKLEPKRKGDKEWTNVVDAAGELYIAFGSKLTALLEQLIQEKAPVVLETKQTKKGYREIVKATRWAPPTVPTQVDLVPVEEIPF